MKKILILQFLIQNGEPFFIEMQNNILFVSDYLGNIYYVNDLDKKINSGEKELKLNKIETNINPQKSF